MARKPNLAEPEPKKDSGCAAVTVPLLVIHSRAEVLYDCPAGPLF